MARKGKLRKLCNKYDKEAARRKLKLEILGMVPLSDKAVIYNFLGSPMVSRRWGLMMGYYLGTPPDVELLEDPNLFFEQSVDVMLPKTLPTFLKGFAEYERLVRAMLNPLRATTLREISRRYWNAHKSPESPHGTTKDEVKQWLFEAMFGLDALSDTRKREGELAADYRDHVFEICGGDGRVFLLPNEIIGVILGFVESGRETLDSVGCVSYQWYVEVLKAWNKPITLSKTRHLRKIPRMVLNAAKTVRICPNNTTFT